ncbi:MAG: hypothetical protein GYB33_04695 [Gammaproteobacteria bacterium]|uniref:DUF6491 family protein n=1 Tax=Pseudomaricurvus alcaniphilus TaxID=1166482 RepID=UPI001407D2BC|nr:DUF6491 family protein [Pseudomaricurvus alcaniphilus]MBR9909638.1 hypothetical protein [Gammaproteobacteria bacterium]NHN36946.1 hypothetical protein [Pseudomaricurvus alcaniphilus]
MKTTSALLIALLGLGGHSFADQHQDAEDDNVMVPGTERCLSLTRINSTRVLDNQRIAFHLSGKKVYINVLPRPCPGLRKDSTIMYRVTMSQLCDMDLITVLDPMGGGFMPGASCGLGKFVPATSEDLKPLRYETLKDE